MSIPKFKKRTLMYQDCHEFRGDFTLFDMPTERLVVIGDVHHSPAEDSLWREEIIPDLMAEEPNRVLFLGDLTGGAMGQSHSTKEAIAAFSGIHVPWHSIIGNHDLQGLEEFDSDEANVQMMIDALGRDTPYFTIEEERVAFIGLSNTFWRRNQGNKNEIVIDEAQLAWWEGELKRLGDKPVVIICHTPPIGSGVMVMSELHARVGNAYTNQSVIPGRIQEVVWNHANILFWFSGHNHLGQHYRDAIAQRLGVHYVHTGTASRIYGRDGARHSRILEIGENSFRIRTFDHGLRAIDPTLDYNGSQSVEELVQMRRQMIQKRYVPTDPATMAQGVGKAARAGNVERFVFLSDVHSIAKLAPIQSRIAGWCTREIRAFAPDRIIYGGDITHRAITEQAIAFHTALGTRDLPIDYLPGNNEGPDFCYPENTNPIHGSVKAGERVFMLATTNKVDATASAETLLRQLPADGSVLVFAHFPPLLLGEGIEQRLQDGPAKIQWICGHRHQSTQTQTGNLHVTICAGLDPIKVRHSAPELLVIDWDGSHASIQQIRVPDRVLFPHTPVHYAGLAYRGTGEALLQHALEHGVPAIQLHYRYSQGEPSDVEKELAQRYRDKGGFLSIHLPNFPHAAEGPDLADQELWLQFGEGVGVADYTIHLPSVTASYLYDEERAIKDTDWARDCLRTYCDLSRRALANGAQISFENVYNKKVNEPGEEILSTQPWHLVKFVEALRAQLLAEGITADAVKRVGIIFDAGHAFADAQFSKHHGLADWLVQVSPYLQLSHIHQVKPRPDGAGTHHHQRISDKNAPLINYQGLLSAFRDVSKKAFPLLIEIRGKEDAIASYEALTQTGLLATPRLR